MDALSDPTRLRLLRLLEQHELGVVDLCDILQLPQSTVSRHLKVLSDQRWTRSRREGTAHLYRMAADELDPAARRLWLLAREQTDAWATLRQDALRLARRLSERDGDSQAFFQGAAGEWDKLRGELYGQGFNLAAAASLLPPDHVVADLGCGTGAAAAQLAPFVKRVIAVDDSPAMLKAARKRLEGLENIDLRRGDLSALPIEAETCDAASLTLVLTYVADVAAALAETARILKPGGRVAIVDLLPHDRDDFRRLMQQHHAGLEPAKLSEMLQAAGFEPPAIRPLPPEPAAKGPALFVATGVKR
jgi:ArsR family transcriptional regulator